MKTVNWNETVDRVDSTQVKNYVDLIYGEIVIRVAERMKVDLQEFCKQYGDTCLACVQHIVNIKGILGQDEVVDLLDSIYLQVQLRNTSKRMNEILNSKEDEYRVWKINNIQINLAQRLNISLSEFCETYSEVTRGFIERDLYGVEDGRVAGHILSTRLEDRLYKHLVQHYFGGKIEEKEEIE